MSVEDVTLLINCYSKPCLNTTFFNHIAFDKLHRFKTNSYYFTQYNKKTNNIDGVVRFLEKEPGHFASPWKGTFGGFEMVTEKLSIPNMEKFAFEVESYLKSVGGKKLTLVLPPFIYNIPQTSIWMNILLRSGYRIENAELNYSMSVKQPFIDNLDRGNRKQLKKSENEGLVCTLLDISEFETAYNVLKENRAKKNIVISMTWPDMLEMCQKCPERIVFFGVKQKEKIIASAFCIQVNHKSLYVFFWGEIAGVENFSPVTLLAQNIYDYCLANNISLMDVGTSTHESVPNIGLIRYKRNLGFEESIKFVMTKDL